MRMCSRLLAIAVILSLSGCRRETVYDISKDQGLSETRPIYSEKPTCTPKREGLRGTIWVTAVVRPDGTVGDVQPLKSEVSEAGCDHAVVTAVKRWRFEPIRKSGRVVTARIITGAGFPF